MKNKPNISKLVSNMKKDIKEKPGPIIIPHPGEKYKERDMRQEAREMGSHGAEDYWGEHESAV